MAIQQWREALAPYGAWVTDEGFIMKGSKVLSVKITEKKGRLRYESLNGMVASGMSPDQFVRSFWFWEKQT